MCCPGSKWCATVHLHCMQCVAVVNALLSSMNLICNWSSQCLRHCLGVSCSPVLVMGSAVVIIDFPDRWFSGRTTYVSVGQSMTVTNASGNLYTDSVGSWPMDEFGYEATWRLHHGFHIMNQWYTLNFESHGVTNVPLFRVYKWRSMMF